MLIENIDSDYHATKVVITLIEDLLHKGHCVYIDNWYTSIEMCNVLIRILLMSSVLYDETAKVYLVGS